MLPSSGYFKGYNCPFFDSGLCGRPYCHFRHVKKYNTCTEGSECGDISNTENKQLSNAVHNDSSQSISSVIDVPSKPTKATYNPTPISELNRTNNRDHHNLENASEQIKKHIPVPYTPRKPASLVLKRPVDDEPCDLFVYNPEKNESMQVDPSNLKSDCSHNDIPSDNSLNSTFHYVPTGSNDKRIGTLEYKPTKLTHTKTTVKYQPTPRALVPCFSSDEDEPDTKKRKPGDLNGLDDLGPEFDILDQILDEEKLDSSEKQESCTFPDEAIQNDKPTVNECSAKQKETKHVLSKIEQIEKSLSSKSQHKSSENISKEYRKSKHHNKSKSTVTSNRDSKSKISSFPKKSEKDQKHHKSHTKSRKSDKSCKTAMRKNTENKNDARTKNFDTNINVESLTDVTNLSDSDEETIALECKRIFDEYVPELKDDMQICDVDKESTNDYMPAKKRISRAMDKDLKIAPKPIVKPNFKVHAAQAMAERLTKVKNFHLSRNPNILPLNLNTNSRPDMPKNILGPSSNNNTKIRIAHVPYASVLVNAKKQIGTKSIDVDSVALEPSTSSTIVQTNKKGTQRIAHLPSEKFIDRPSVLEPLASKIPANIRSTYLNLMIDECLKIYILPVDAYARAQHEELMTNKKCNTVPIYKNSAMLTVSRLRKELKECNGIKKSSLDHCQVNHESSKAHSKNIGSWSIENKSRNIIDEANFKGIKFYENIYKWILTEEQLQNNGFPRPHPNGKKGRAIIYGQNKQKPPKGNIRTCSRCKKDYTIDKKGFPAVKEECIYHPNNKYRIRGEAKYQCCGQDGSSDGCCIATNHVYEYVDFDNLRGYVKTLPSDSSTNDYGVYSLDCEMCYTTHGLDLTRVTVINCSCKVVYESLIKPLHPIVDYNTRYSGITEEQMAKVKTTLLDVQAALLSMFNSKTILIGHSLESDFKALKIIHDTVIDTSVLFPHKMGPPYKRALRNLSSEFLKKIIQNSVEGHDSAEDAVVCMELIHYKLKEDLKTR